MTIQDLSSESVQKFIQDNGHLSSDELLLKGKKYPEFDMPFLVAQIEGKRKAKEKLPSFFDLPTLVYPLKISLEQCSSERTAEYKASLVGGNTLIDLTGGFGVDCWAFSKKVQQVIYVERDKLLTEIVLHNFKQFGIKNGQVVHEDSSLFLNQVNGKVDWIYLDPARRKEGSRVMKLQDCEPNILDQKERLLSKANFILLKTSPLLDIDLAIKELKQVLSVHILAVENDCKELLFVLGPVVEGAEPLRRAVNFKKNGEQEVFSFTKPEEVEAENNFGLPLTYLYEPNSAVLKSGAFKKIGQVFGLKKLHVNSHLYTSEERVENFPGRVFKIEHNLKYSKEEVAKVLLAGKANVVSRNFPDSPEVIKKKLKLKDGGEDYLFATTTLDKKLIILVTKKIKANGA